MYHFSAAGRNSDLASAETSQDGWNKTMTLDPRRQLNAAQDSPGGVMFQRAFYQKSVFRGKEGTL